MSKTRSWIAGLTIVSLLAVGVIALAGNGFGSSTSWNPPQAACGDCGLHERDADSEGILNSGDSDWVRPLDGSGYGQGPGHGINQSGSRPLNGTGFGARRGGGQGQRDCSGSCDGSCL